MTEQEKINLEMQTKLAIHDEQFAIFMEELKQQREDIRRLNARIDSKFYSINNQSHNFKSRNFTISAMVGFIALAFTVGGLVVSLLK